MVGGVDASCAVAGAKSPGATALFDHVRRSRAIACSPEKKKTPTLTLPRSTRGGERNGTMATCDYPLGRNNIPVFGCIDGGRTF